MKTFTVRQFNTNVNRTLKNASRKEKATFRMVMLYKALRYSVKGTTN